ncbi:hypothetical protein [Streptomyces huiliensis]|uniref:hypothetical protein n=1 Tax=Streptomyces huiliensis TaxID=2876027 RepID=UPI001CBF6A33|nr:hypothetical protein [Streptomyces huiliensis]MBZ4322959.1 hypothetical protein [Streptomyces huiliensis]
MEDSVLELQELPEAQGAAHEPWMCCDTARDQLGHHGPAALPALLTARGPAFRRGRR